MNRKKEEFAEYLFDEIGNIDDSIIASAMGAYRPARKVFNTRKLAIAAVAATLSLSLFATVFVSILNRAGKDYFESPKNDNVSNSADNDDAADKYEPDMESPTDVATTLATRLESLRDTAKAEKLGKNDIKYFDGYARLIWKYSDEEYYRVCKISASQLQRIQSLISADQGELVNSAAESSVDGIWISLGDGKVISPCLLSSEGNVGYGSIFDYTAEVEPSDAVSGFICDIIG